MFFCFFSSFFQFFLSFFLLFFLFRGKKPKKKKEGKNSAGLPKKKETEKRNVPVFVGGEFWRVSTVIPFQTARRFVFASAACDSCRTDLPRLPLKLGPIHLSHRPPNQPA